MSFWKTVIILSPLFYALTLLALQFVERITTQYELGQILKQNSQTAEEKTLLAASIKEIEKLTFIDKINSQLNVYGIHYKFEFILLGVFFLGFVLSVLLHLLIKAGPLLMIYIVGVCIFVAYESLKTNIGKRKDALTLEFLEKLRDLTSYLSAGKTVPVALDECIGSGSISPVLYQQMAIVRGDISLGKEMSVAFMEMYRRLNINEIKTFAQTLQVHEEHGGNLIEIMQSTDRYFSQKLLVKNEQRVASSEIKNTQKIMIGAPLGFVAVMVLINPSFFGDFYGTITGQITGIIAITMLLTGVFLSRRILKI